MSRSLKPSREQMERSIDRLYKAVVHYVSMNGGNVLVIGGIQIQEWPDKGKFSFTVGIQCTGTKPRFAIDKRNLPKPKVPA